MYAIFRTGGKQFRATPGAQFRIPTLDVEAGEIITFDDVLITGTEGGEVTVGLPSVAGASVKAHVLTHGRGQKVIVFKRKRRKGYRKKQGHRQGFTEIKISEIVV